VSSPDPNDLQRLFDEAVAAPESPLLDAPLERAWDEVLSASSQGRALKNAAILERLSGGWVIAISADEHGIGPLRGFLSDEYGGADVAPGPCQIHVVRFDRSAGILELTTLR
jgi:hypothetical protein